MFRLLTAVTPDDRMSELEQFIEFWYGPRRAEFGEPDAHTHVPSLPGPLRRFHAFAGRWPFPDPQGDDGFFYSGESGHHLFPLEDLVSEPDGRLRFFAEYQGDWNGLTLPGEQDPPVWIRGQWDDPGPTQEVQGHRTRQVSASLSEFLITHCLMATAYEWGNSPSPRTGGGAVDKALAAWLRREWERAELIWRAAPGGCPSYEGSFYLVCGHVLVHDAGRGFYKFGALHPEGVESLREVLGDDA